MARVNRAVELLAQDQPIYYQHLDGLGSGGEEAGRSLAGTWADYLAYDAEHAPFDAGELRAFVSGLVKGDPTRSGHRTPAVIVSLPVAGSSEAAVRANAWMVQQALAAGVHGLLLCHAETPEAVRALVEAARYPHHTRGVGPRLGVGRRGSGGQSHAAAMWGLGVPEYLKRADVWPLNPDGELLLGLKIENVRALANVEASVAVPGIAFAEWGPGDMGLSMGHPGQHDPPYPPDMLAARSRVLAACRAARIAFLDQVTPENVVERIAEGVRIGAGGQAREAAEIGRRHTRRAMPW
jgi:4-hydroxy-2-oxoheptanedioate aldolase